MTDLPTASTFDPEHDRGTATDEPAPGTVYLVGAGPGDPGLITLRGMELLRRADIVFYDYLVNPRILEHVPPRAPQVCLGKHGRSTIWPQSEINRQLVLHAQQGQTVVRLKGGDPAVFGRLAEEVEYLAAHGIRFEIVPGVTAALAAGSFAGIPVTHRGVASAVALVTGHEDDEKTAPALDYQSLASFPGTLVIYMGVTTAPTWCRALVAAGKSADTPAAIIRRCSLPDQRVIRTTLGQLCDHLVPATKMRPPVIVILGEVVDLAPLLSWFDRRPLFGVKVLVTRAREQSAELADLLTEYGAHVFAQPTISIGPPEDWAPLDRCLERLTEFEWLVFSSVNGVRGFFERLTERGRDLRALGPARLAAIGPGTAGELRRYHLIADAVPAEHRAEALADLLTPHAAGKRFLLIRASRGREILAERLRAAGGLVEQVVAYSSVDVVQPAEEIVQLLRSNQLNWITVTSSAIARSLVAMFGDALQHVRLASISPITSGTLRELGLQPAVEATEYTMRGLVGALLRAQREGRGGDQGQTSATG